MQAQQFDTEHAIEILKSGPDAVARWNQVVEEMTAPCLAGAELQGLKLNGINFKKVNLQQANLIEASLENANLQNADLAGMDASKAHFANSCLKQTSASNARFCHADLQNANLEEALLHSTHFSHANLKKTNFVKASLDNNDFSHAIMDGADFRDANLESPRMQEASLIQTRGLHGHSKARIKDPQIIAESARFGYRFDYVPWERISLIGRIPLFGISYLAVFAIVVFVALIRWYNAALAKVSAKVIANTADQWVAEVPAINAPSHFGYLLLAIVSLAIAATLYRLLCPAIVQEYSQTKWVRELREPYIEYMSASFSRIHVRHICAALYALGGLYTLWYLLWRIVDAVRYLLRG